MTTRNSRHVTGTDTTPAYIQRACESSLRRLNTEYIDLYQFHSGTDADFNNDELWEMLGDQKHDRFAIFDSVLGFGKLCVGAADSY